MGMHFKTQEEQAMANAQTSTTFQQTEHMIRDMFQAETISQTPSNPFLVGESDTEFKPCPAGRKQAILHALINVGVQPVALHLLEKFPDMKPQHKIVLVWEVLGEKQTPTSPYLITQTFGLSFHPKSKLRQLIDSWSGEALTPADAKAFDLSKCVGAPAELQVAHKVSASGRKYATILGVFMCEGQHPAPVLEPFIFDCTNKEDMEGDKYHGLFPWIQKMVDSRIG